jgi:hypothetical protein
MSAMQRVNMLAALLTFIFGVSQGWPVTNSLEKALLAYVSMFGAQILIIFGFIRLMGIGRVRAK